MEIVWDREREREREGGGGEGEGGGAKRQIDRKTDKQSKQMARDRETGVQKHLVREPGGPTVHPPSPPPPPPPPPQEPSTMVPKCTLGCPEHNLTCSPENHWDALEL